MKHLLVDISGHGFGHLAQVSTVLNALGERSNTTHVTIRSQLPETLIRERIHLDFDYIEYALDRGMIMQDAMHVDVAASYSWYQHFHGDYDKRIISETETLQQLKPDVLLVDVPYLSLDAAAILQIPSIALCSLNWADIFHAYCGHLPEAESIYKMIVEAYNKADYFLQPVPSMEMPTLLNGLSIAPIAQKGLKQRDALLHGVLSRKPLYDKTSQNIKFALVSLGGISTDLAHLHLPLIANLIWIVPDTLKTERKDIITQSCFGMPFIDLLASVDLIITKTGYGTLVEAVAHQIPVICIERPDWPEEPMLLSWCYEQGYLQSICLEQFNTADLSEAVNSMLQQKWGKPAVNPSGAEQAVEIFLSYLHDSK